MSNLQDEDDDFFADIYGDDSAKDTSSKKDQPTETKPAPAPAPAASSDPRLALFNASTQDVGKKDPEQAPAEASAAAAAPAAAPPSLPSFPAMGGAGEGGMPMNFDPAAFTAQLQQLQQLQALSHPNIAPDLAPAQGGGFMAGKIFIPAKDEGKMFIGGLNWETTDESMKSYFSNFGEVTECMVMRDNVSGRSRGFGFLTFKDPKCVSAVLRQEHHLDGKIIDPKRAIPREEQDKTAKIFVGGVSADVTEEDFKAFFEQYGTVIDAQLMMDKDTGRPRGFGFVTFDSDNAVETIVAEQFLNLKGKPIEVKRAEPRGRDALSNDGRNGRMMGMQQNAYGQGMDPAAMSQYYQQWQQQMAQWQQMMAQSGAAGQDNPMMQMYQQMLQQGQAQMAGAVSGAAPEGSQPPSQSEDGKPQQHHNQGHRDNRHNNRRRDHRRGGNDDRRRSRSPNSRRRGGRDRDHRDNRDRHYNRS